MKLLFHLWTRQPPLKALIKILWIQTQKIQSWKKIRRKALSFQPVWKTCKRGQTHFAHSWKMQYHWGRFCLVLIPLGTVMFGTVFPKTTPYGTVLWQPCWTNNSSPTMTRAEAAPKFTVFPTDSWECGSHTHIKWWTPPPPTANSWMSSTNWTNK